MRKFLFSLLTLVLLWATNASAQAPQKGIRFFEGNYEQALAEARQQNKLLFIDFYAVWCGPCKRMAKDVFTVDSVGAYFNERFISIKIDAEKPENAAVAKQFKVEAFPTLAFVGNDGKALAVNTGAMNAVELLEAARIANGDAVSFEQLYQQYKDDPKNLDIRQELLLKAPNFLAAQEGMDAEKWVVRIRKLYKGYIDDKKGTALINKRDYRIINALGGDDEAGRREMIAFINAHLDEWVKAVGKAAAYYVVEGNDQDIENLIRAGNSDYKIGVEKINGEYRQAYTMIAPPGVAPYERAKTQADALYALYKNKDAERYVTAINDYFKMLGDQVTPADYGKAAQDLYYAAGDKLKAEQHRQAIVWLEAAIPGEPVLLNRINYLVMLGDSHRALKDYATARGYYNQANAESLQMGNLQTAQQMVQAAIFRKLSELELLEK